MRSLAIVLMYRIYITLTFAGVNPAWLDQVLGTQSPSNAKYKNVLIDRLLQIIDQSGQLGACMAFFRIVGQTIMGPFEFQVVAFVSSPSNCPSSFCAKLWANAMSRAR